MTATLAPDAQSLSSATPRGEADAPLKQPAAPRRVSRFVPRMLMAPAVVSLLLWMIVPLVMTVWFSLIRYNLMQPGEHGFVGLENYTYFMFVGLLPWIWFSSTIGGGAGTISERRDLLTKVRFPAQRVEQIRVRPYYTETDSLAVAVSVEEATS